MNANINLTACENAEMMAWFIAIKEQLVMYLSTDLTSEMRSTHESDLVKIDEEIASLSA